MASGRVQYDGWTTEELIPGLTIFRSGNVRMLSALSVAIANPIVTLPSGDRPANTINNVATRDDGNGSKTTCLFRVFSSGNVVFATYSGSSYSAGIGMGNLIWAV